MTQMLVTLSVDHRVYDGDTGGAFLETYVLLISLHTLILKSSCPHM